jgi:hypothetical protein
MYFELAQPSRLHSSTLRPPFAYPLYVTTLLAIAGSPLSHVPPHHSLCPCPLLDQMVRCFSDPEVVHVDGSVDPVRDLRVIHNELVRSAPLTY